MDYIYIRHGIVADKGVKIVDFDAKRLQRGDGCRVILFDNGIAQGVLFALDGRVYRGRRGEDDLCVRKVAAKFAVDADKRLYIVFTRRKRFSTVTLPHIP